MPYAAPGTGADAAAAATRRPAVYLAECSYDRRADRQALNSELRARNYHVLPDRELPRDEAEYRAEVARPLEQSVLSIHLVGSVYGSVPDGPSQWAGVVTRMSLRWWARSAGRSA